MVLYRSGRVQAGWSRLNREPDTDRTLYTSNFRVDDPLLIDFRVSSPNPRLMSISVILIDAKTDSHAGSVLQTMREGDGLRLMNESGVFHFRIDAREVGWNIKVIQLNREEARLYTPKN